MVAESGEDLQLAKQEVMEASTQAETRVCTDCSKEETPDLTKDGEHTVNQPSVETKNGAENPPIKDFDWVYFKFEKETFYLNEFLALHPAERLDKRSLGIEEEKQEKGKDTPSSKGEVKEEPPTQFLGKRAMPDLDCGFGSRGFAKVINTIEERIHKFGKLGEDEDCIRRKQHNNDEFYEQDDFIDDHVDMLAPQTMEIPISRYEDFFVVKGNIESFKKHKKFNERIAEVKQRNRDSKNKKNEQSRKKREDLQIQSLMKGDKKQTPAEDKPKSQQKAKSNPATVLTKIKTKKAGIKKGPESAKQKVSAAIISKQS